MSARLLLVALVAFVLGAGGGSLVGYLVGSDEAGGSAGTVRGDVDGGVVAADAGDGTLLLEVDEDALADAGEDVAAVVAAAGLDQLVAELDAELALPEDVTLTIREDPDEAFYDEGAREIVIAPSYVASSLAWFDEVWEDPADAEAAAASDLAFTTLHEVGHALVDVLELPITGREEAAVDEFAGVALATWLEDPVAVLDASDLFDVLAEQPTESDYYGEHGLDQQRAFDLRCLVYGLDPDGFGDVLDGLPVEDYRAGLCEEDAARAADSWTELLEPWAEPA